jgi:DNA-binding transcriptional ArsR family regulator
MAVSGPKDLREGLVFRALGDSTRRGILDILKKHPGITVAELEPLFSMSRFNIMKHLNVLEEAGLVDREREGTSRRIYLRTESLRLAYERCKDWL